jgi:DNA-binding NarL/FixJ family response regulator
VTTPIRVVLADDHRFFRDGVRLVLDAAPDIEVVGEAATGEEAVAQTEAAQPDVVVMDVSMPGTNGIDATRRILHSLPSLQVLVLTMHEDDDLVFAAMRAGARGYLLKTPVPMSCCGRYGRFPTEKPFSARQSPGVWLNTSRIRAPWSQSRCFQI